ncbi:MAG: hypothetical protein DBX55_10250 [Verrucomicrobia bacterium]|nr:MAG: hypothetical protein DBX55_10250 [Verrucomicrobiota bacterium]
MGRHADSRIARFLSFLSAAFAQVKDYPAHLAKSRIYSARLICLSAQVRGELFFYVYARSGAQFRDGMFNAFFCAKNACVPEDSISCLLVVSYCKVCAGKK